LGRAQISWCLVPTLSPNNRLHPNISGCLSVTSSVGPGP
jgi:hypothetical protein